MVLIVPYLTSIERTVWKEPLLSNLKTFYEYDSKTKIKHTDSIFGIPGHSPLGCTHDSEGQPSLTEQELVLTHQPHLY